ncbi:hypothetical protein E6O75_ATG05223 [Venturia nashicola]|uniref:Uncharacterized protein n=1 Tax=Venturia nashicola TaxID=86259 RepID=A0A4Z1P039_9PEZI|nr:hypothetical protein E6O75_ATG05223 [Venturia nashicola]
MAHRFGVSLPPQDKADARVEFKFSQFRIDCNTNFWPSSKVMTERQRIEGIALGSRLWSEPAIPRRRRSNGLALGRAGLSISWVIGFLSSWKRAPGFTDEWSRACGCGCRGGRAKLDGSEVRGSYFVLCTEKAVAREVQLAHTGRDKRPQCCWSRAFLSVSESAWVSGHLLPHAVRTMFSPWEKRDRLFPPPSSRASSRRDSRERRGEMERLCSAQ